MLQGGGPVDWVLQGMVLLFSVIVHEVSHGKMAERLGDDTARLAGRLTFNPVPHVDPIGTILLPALCAMSGAPLFGWARPVPVNPGRLNHPRADNIKVAAVGPLSNVALACFAALVFRGALAASFLPEAFRLIVAKTAAVGVLLNLVLAFFNLIPVHPLDGSHVLEGLLPPRAALRYARLAPYGFMIILAMLFLGLTRWLVALPSLAIARLLIGY